MGLLWRPPCCCWACRALSGTRHQCSRRWAATATLPLSSAHVVASYCVGTDLIYLSWHLQAGDDEQVTKNLLLSGFPGSTASGPGVFEAQKPTWETGSKAAISLRSKPTQQARAPAPAPTTTAAATARAWVLTDGNGGVEELVDEDTLLTEEDKARPQAPPSRDDCEAGASGRKACKNCTCGRAEDEAPQIKLTTDMLENPQPTGCGNVSGL